MSFEERGAWSALLSTVVVFALWGWPIWSGTASGAYDGAGGLTLWAWDVVWLIGGGAALCFAIMLIVNGAFAFVTGREALRFVSDERDDATTRRAAVVSLVTISCGFLAAVALLASGRGALAALNAILAGMALAGVASTLWRLAVYRLGL